MAEPVNPVKSPEWLRILEEKKNRPHRLAHEIGAGAPCIICGEKCPGLDLHFWRKLCRNCKCKKEDHDVKDDDGYAQFEILLGVGGKQKKLGGVLKIKVPEVRNNAVKGVVGNNTNVEFDWVPPNVTEDVAAEYMGQLPSAKLPISGSDGALYRKQQLEKQMPLHDLDASRCHNLTPHEADELQKYLDNLKNNVVGQGRVTKVPTLYTEQRVSCHGPTVGQNSSQQVPLLPLSRSEDSLKSMRALPAAYNAAPRPFLPQINNDVAPPLPKSLPPSDAKSNLKMPSSFVLHKTVNNTISDECASSQQRHSGQHSVSNSLLSQLTSDFSQLHVNQSVAGHLGNSLPQHRDGLISSQEYSSSVIHSSEVLGQQMPSLSQTLQNSRPTAPYVPNGSNSLSKTMGSPSGQEHSLNIAPNHGSVVHSIHCQSLSSSDPSPRPVAPNTSHPLSAKSAQLPCNCGAIDGQSIPLADTGPPTSISGMSHPFSEMSHVTSDKIAPSNVTPSYGSVVHSVHCQSLSSSDSVPGVSRPEMASLLTSRGFARPCNCGAIDGQTHLPSDISSSASDSESNLRSSGPLRDPPNKEGGVHQVPNHGSIVHSVHCQSVSSSGIVPTQVNPEMANLLIAKDSPLPCNCGALAMHSTGTGLLTDPLTGKLVCESRDVDGTYSQPFNNELGSGGDSGQVNLESNNKFNNYAVNNNNQLQAQTPDVPWNYSSQMPAPSHYEYAFQPQYDVSFSSDINAESMPLSAQIIQQRKPDDTNTPHLNLLAQEENVKSHLNCHYCKEVLMSGDVAVFADRAGDNTAWHPQCFVCKTCDELLVDLMYFFNKGNVYCGRHFAELLAIPRCFACDELIFVKEYTVAEEKTFHVRHFCCYECDEPLAGKQYVPTDDQPTCLDCYEEIFGKRCHTCKLKIAAGERRVGFKELNWHAKEACFCCYACQKSLLGTKFVLEDNQPYCNRDCVQLVN